VSKKLPLVLTTGTGELRESPPFSYNNRSHYLDEHIQSVIHDPIRLMDRLSIRWYMEHNLNYLAGRVLDYGAGTSPYRNLVTGEYFPYQFGESWPGGDFFDAVMVNQVLQYVEWPLITLENLRDVLKPSGHIVMTFATNWDEVPNDCYHGEFCDRWRFTAKGMEYLFKMAGFEVLDLTRRCEVRVGSFTFPIGYGIVGRKKE